MSNSQQTNLTRQEGDGECQGGEVSLPSSREAWDSICYNYHNTHPRLFTRWPRARWVRLTDNGQRGSERLSDLPRVTQLLAGWSCSFIHPSLTRCHGGCQQWEPDRQVTLSLAGQPDAGSFPHTGLHMGQPCPSAPVVQWLRLCLPSAGGPGSIPGRRTKSPLQLRAHKTQVKFPRASAEAQHSPIRIFF